MRLAEETASAGKVHLEVRHFQKNVGKVRTIGFVRFRFSFEGSQAFTDVGTLDYGN